MRSKPAVQRRSRSPRAPARPTATAEARLLEAFIAAWPGPAAWLGRDGAVLSSNASAGGLLDELMQRAGRGGLAAVVGSAQDDGLGRADTIVIAADGAKFTFDVSVVPAGTGALVLARDVSLAANLRQALSDSRQRFKDLVEISSDFAWETNTDGIFTFVSPKGALGWMAADLVGRRASSLIADALPDRDTKPATPFTTRVLVDQAELWLQRADAAPACVSISALPLVAADGTWRGARGVWRDVTAGHERDAALADAQNRERLVGYIVRTIRDEVEPDAMLAAAASAAARALGAAGCRIWGCGAEGNLMPVAEFGGALPEPLARHMDAQAKHLTQAGEASGRDEVELTTGAGQFLGAVTRFRRQINGAIGLWRSTTDPGWSEADHEIVAKLADQIGIAQEQIANHEALAKQARTDALTGLLNRRSFTKRLEESLADCVRTGQPGTLVYVDLDNFKAVNDRLGHQAGDAALKALASCPKRLARASDFVARLGGDEFALWLATADADAAVARGKVILALKDEIAPFSAGADKPLGLSVGLAVYAPREPETVAELLARADGAMYAVKQKGKGSYALAPAAKAHS
ncbi:MAG: diguanylate cyclase [Alphaproteobacteria bacterium]|nr:diguanylate cyclase [Alphaproteobacteria bacterium]